MSFFSDLIKGKKKTKTYTQVAMSNTEIIEEDVLDNTRKRLILKYVKTGYGSRNYALDYGNTGAAQFFQYRLAGSTFPDGIPTITVGGAGVPITEIQNILNIRYKQTVTISEYYTLQLSATRVIVGPPIAFYNNFEPLAYLCKGYLSDKYDYDFRTDTLYYTNGSTYKYTSCDFYVGSKSSAFVTITMSRKSGSGTQTLVLNVSSSAIFSWDTLNWWTSGEVDLPHSDYAVTVPYYIVTYRIPSTGRTKLWVYPPLINSRYWGTRYTQLDLNSFEDTDEIGYATQYNSYENYPIVALRKDKKDIVSYENSTVLSEKKIYNETVNILANLGLDLKTLTNAYIDPGNGSTVQYLKDAFFQIGVSPANNASIVSQCLYKVFDDIYTKLPNSRNSYWDIYTLGIEEGNYNTYLEWVPRQAKTILNTAGGSAFEKRVDPIGTYSHEIKKLTTTEATDTRTITTGGAYTHFEIGPPIPSLSDNFTVFLLDATPPGMYYVTRTGDQDIYPFCGFTPEFKGVQFEINQDDVNSIKEKASWIIGPNSWVGAGQGTVRIKQTISQTNSYRLTLKYQVTANSIRLIYIDNLRSYTGIIAKSGTNHQIENLLKTWKKDTNGKIITPMVLTNENNFDMLIPLPVNVVENLSFMERTDLLSHCMHLIFYSENTQTVTYREGGVLKNLLKIAGIIISIIISVVAPPAGAAMLASGATVTAALGNVLSNLFISFLVGMALSVALKVIMDVAGKGLFGKILAALTIVASIYLTGGFDNAFASVGDTVKLASKLAEIPSKIIEMSVGEGLKEVEQGYKTLTGQIENFEDKYTTKAEEFDNILKQLDSDRFGVTTEFLVDLMRIPDINDFYDGRILSPTAFYQGAIQSQYDLGVLYNNDIETYGSRSLSVGLIE